MDFNNLEQYLREGGDPQVIAQAFANKLNNMIAKINQESAIEEEAENVVKAWRKFIEAYFEVNEIPDGFLIEDFEFKTEEVVKIIETFVSIAPYFEKYVSAIEKFSNNTEVIKDNSKKLEHTFEDTITKFFNKMNI